MFDSIDHKLLAEIPLEKFRTGEPILRSFIDYILDRSRMVKQNQQILETEKILCGIPQSTVIGPLILNLYIKSITDGLRSKFYLYADGLALYYFGDDIGKVF